MIVPCLIFDDCAVAQDRNVGSSARENRGGPARKRSRSSRQAFTENLTRHVNKVERELENTNGLVQHLLVEILEGPQ